MPTSTPLRGARESLIRAGQAMIDARTTLETANVDQEMQERITNLWSLLWDAITDLEHRADNVGETN